MSNNLWLGSHQSYEAVVEAKANAMAMMGRSEKPELPELLSVQGNVGIVDIRGSLVNGNAGFMRYFGVTGYGDIRDALVAAIQHPDVSSILLNIDSGGGAVSGVHETAQLISRVDKVKPVFSYTGGIEASAALWLGSSARKSVIAETGLAGSLGIIMIHAERSRQLANDGVSVTVVRAGSEKALANSYEPLTPEAKASLESKAQAMYDVFLGHVADMRGMTATAADAKFGQGREFVGKQAVTAGLMDSVGTLEDAYSMAAEVAPKKKMKSGAKANTSTSFSDNIPKVLGTSLAGEFMAVDNAATIEGTSMPKPLTQKQLVAMAAGVDLDLEVAKTPEELAAEASAAPAAADTAATASTETQAADKPAPSLTEYLQTQVATLQAELLTLKMEAKTATEGLEASKSNLEALATITRNSLKTMTIALGGKGSSIDVLPIAELAAEHARVVPLFVKEFKVGAVAATNPSSENKQVAAILDPRLAALASKLPSGKR